MTSSSSAADESTNHKSTDDNLVGDELIERLASEQTIDITTIGRKTGKLARIEIWWFRVDGRFIITGTPQPRDWYANLLANSTIIVHASFGDFGGSAVPVTDEADRRLLLSDPQLSWYSDKTELDALVASSPLVQLTLDSLG